jgi:uncharacterized protein (TIGR02231 family)
MKRTLIFLLLPLFIPVVSWGQSAENLLDSRISEVSVFRQRAQLTRTATTTLPAGDHLLVFSGLSRFLLPNSIMVAGKGSGLIQAVSHRVNFLSKSPKPPRMLQLEDSLEALATEMQVLSDERFVAQQEEKLLLANQQIGGSEQGVDPAALRQMAALYRERLSSIRQTLRRIAQQEQQDKERQEALKRELNQITAQRNQPTQEVVVAFRAEKAGKVSLEMNYLVERAAWTPMYDVRAGSTGEPLQFYLKAQVVNNTGIDWSGVDLTLSTGLNDPNSQRPTLNPWYVDLARGYPAPAAPAMSRQRDALSNTFDDFGAGELAMEEAEADIGYAADLTTLSEGELGMEFNIALPYDIPADGQPHQVDIQLIEVPGKFRHFAVPKLDGDAFLVAAIQQDLLRGQANVYFEGTFVGETYVNTDNPRDSMLISLGRDPKLQVSREQVKDYAEERFIGSNVRQTFAYEITVRNNKTEAVSLTLLDQVPVSQNKDITVTGEELSGGQLDAGSGRVTWDLSLPAGETRTLRLVFEVKYPKDEPIQGL